jgi:hypothetical protein
MNKPNGHDRSASALHGHTLPLASREARGALLEPGGAASDDRRDFPTAAGATAPAGMERDGRAEVAPSGGKKKSAGSKSSKANGANGHAAPALANAAPHFTTEEQTQMATHSNDPENAMVDIPPGIAPLAADGQGFVDTMHAHVDLYLACARLVRSSDEKIAQRMVERLLEMSYGKSPSPATEDAAPAHCDLPQPPHE